MNIMQVLSMLPQLRQNPAAVLAQRGIQLPQGMNDPNAILDYMVENGKVSREQVEQAKALFGINR